MPCFHPIRAFRCSDGSIIFDERKGDAVHDLHLPCGQCDGCKLERSRQWAVRCMHESMFHEQNSFITLTYNDKHLPMYGHLEYDDFQRFMKRLRKAFSYALPTKQHHGPKRAIRYFMCGEYGENNERPHFHACLFGLDFPDRVFFKNGTAGSKIYTSKTLDNLWTTRRGDPLGFTTVGDVTFNSAGYVARYLLKKQNGRGSERQYQDIDVETGEVLSRPKEFNRMSLKPGIGTRFYQQFKNDMYPHDHVIVNGKKTKPPKFYSKKLAEDDPMLYDDLQYLRHEQAAARSGDNTEERRAVKEKVLQAQIKLLKRELI